MLASESLQFWNDLALNNIGQNGCNSFYMKTWMQLQSLNLSKTEFRQATVILATRDAQVYPNESKYQFMNKVNNRIGDTGFQHLSKSRWKKLQKISLSK